ncbi:MAG: trypsin-like serine protease [Hyalangium sp.]
MPSVRFRVEGEPDLDNRYAAAVRVTPKALELIDGLRGCSGVIISPHLVLTAGHCVCQNHPPMTRGPVAQQVDGSGCVETASVDLFFYEYDPRRPREAPGHTSAQYLGRVHPHPRLDVRSNAQGEILSSHADLALIALDTPVPQGFRPAPIATTGVALQESLALVGFGHAEELGWLDDTRLINKRKVAAAVDAAGERFQLEQQSESFFRGDSGGPCFRDSPQGPTLVGISTTGLGPQPTLTALLAYREWLQQEIQRAETPGEFTP